MQANRRPKQIKSLVLAGLACLMTSALAADRPLRLPLRAFVLKVDYPGKPMDPSVWDPALSQVDYQVAMVQALYSPLLEFDEQSQLRPGWAKSFTWTDAYTLTLVIRQDKRLADGSQLQAEDVIGSLKRMAFMQQFTHAFYVEQFCHTSTLHHMSDPCPGLTGAGDQVSIQTKDRLTFLPKLLAGIETSIVPRAAYHQESPEKLDHSKGSGPFRIDAWKGERLILKANLQHFNFDENMPHTLEFVPSQDMTAATLAEAFRRGEIDHIPTFSALNVLEFDKLARQLEGESNGRRTPPMGLGLLYYSSEAFSELTPAVRQLLVLRLQAATEACLKAAQQDQLRHPTIVLIPPTGIGMLGRDELNYLNVIRSRSQTLPLPRPIRVQFPRSIGSQLEPCMKRELTDLPIVFNASAKETADLRFSSIDMSTYEDFGTARSLIVGGFLDPYPLGRQEWLNSYMGAYNSERRMDMLKLAHLRAIWFDPAIIPLWNFETGALIRKPWTMNFPLLSVRNPFHQIRYAEDTVGISQGLAPIDSREP